VPSVDAVSRGLRARIPRYDWEAIARSLDDVGYARLPRLLDATQCRALVRLYPERERFRSFVDMGKHRFGEGEYRYFGAPLPDVVQTLRTELYARLAPIANAWSERRGEEPTLPRQLRDYQRLCHAAGQTRPTPLLLHYRAGGYNCLHQDLYGALAFPLQVTILLSEPARDFDGGELLLVENRPRMQSRGTAIRLARGEGVVFPCRERPIQGTRGTYRAATRHGVSALHEGERFALGIIFHDAR
jgi:uncharacterized protein